MLKIYYVGYLIYFSCFFGVKSCCLWKVVPLKLFYFGKRVERHNKNVVNHLVCFKKWNSLVIFFIVSSRILVIIVFLNIGPIQFKILTAKSFINFSRPMSLNKNQYNLDSTSKEESDQDNLLVNGHRYC